MTQDLLTGASFKWVSAALTDEYPGYAPGSLVFVLPISEDLAQDTAVLVDYLRREGLTALANVIEGERAS